jgi:hypothetical protein
MNDGGDPSSAITDHICRILLRYFRKAIQADAAASRLDVHRDRELLRLHWSISPSVRALTHYILRNRHETQSFLTFRVRSNDGPIRGRLDARASMIRQMVTAHPSGTISYEPVRSFASGPNHVLAWVLQQAWLLAAHFLAMLPADASYRLMVEDDAVKLDQIRKIESIRRAMAEVALTRRPGGGALQEAARSRRRVYRLAYEAFVTLVDIEAGDLEAIERVLRDTLLTPIDVWKRFELAVGLSLAEALEEAHQEPLLLNVLAGDNRTPIARVGRFAVFWQTTTALYEPSAPEPSEEVARRLLAGYGMRPDSDRPDLIVTDQEAGRVIAVAEAKFFSAAGEDAWDRLRDATHQVIRYGRGYRSMREIDQLLERSVIALVRRPELPVPFPRGVPLVVDFADIRGGALRAWAAQAIQRP